MSRRTPWFERQFPSELERDRVPGLIERLDGTPVRAAARVRALPPDGWTWHPRQGAWSIQEHVGHLGDLEELWLGRLDDFERGVETMRPADLENRATHEAGHDAARMDDLVERFRNRRGELVRRLLGYDAELHERVVRHPRLGQPMRLVDLAYFVAEHDDHHFTLIREVVAGFQARGRSVGREGVQ